MPLVAPPVSFQVKSSPTLKTRIFPTFCSETRTIQLRIKSTPRNISFDSDYDEFFAGTHLDSLYSFISDIQVFNLEADNTHLETTYAAWRLMRCVWTELKRLNSQEPIDYSVAYVHNDVLHQCNCGVKIQFDFLPPHFGTQTATTPHKVQVIYASKPGPWPEPTA